jgi:FlaA1/EpsC-like NDP-sugar epimerase
MRLNFRKKIKSPPYTVAIDLTMVLAAWFGAYWVRFNFDTIPEHYYQSVIEMAVVVLVIQGAVLFWFGVFRGIWRYVSLNDLVAIFKAVFVGTAMAMTMLFLIARLGNVPRAVPTIYFMLIIVFLAGPRVLYRWITEQQMVLGSGKRVLIVGAGQAVELLIRDMMLSAGRNYQPVVIVDDKPGSLGHQVNGVPVVGNCEEIQDLCDKLDIDLIILAMPAASSAQMRRIIAFCEKTELPFRIVPGLESHTSGHVAINDLREVSIEDIMGRDPVVLDWSAISAGLEGRTILVTGAGGSIGSELCRQIAKLAPSKLVLLENYEHNLHAIEMELCREFSELPMVFHLGDVSDIATVRRVYEQNHPDVVFHAAAYKHIPILEGQVREAIKNNVVGTYNVAVEAARSGCSEFVFISSDKAANPSNVMGASKRIAEIFCQNLNVRSDTNFITVRFGNVLGSAGSVVPLFRKQIAEGGPVTVTHPEIERYFMTIPEACQLIMQASVLGTGGEIFVLDMGEPVKISYLAEQMIRLSGKEPGSDIEIAVTGLRPGEKLYEELFHDSEQLEPTRHEKILLARHRSVEWESLEALIERMANACEHYDETELYQSIEEFVPENRIKRLADDLDSASTSHALES